ncbi:actin-like ATPase domain-containing protein [Obba rivulosa]|uniref:Actin-like ATPase domain-containing protein n=1 Tax=Obba rivulosa TaxID=1052685 RepID=A0A8E2DNR2_9APHY|nr:actin-like ATPase domain-containing protein [Obba rivulosa]
MLSMRWLEGKADMVVRLETQSTAARGTRSRTASRSLRWLLPPASSHEHPRLSRRQHHRPRHRQDRHTRRPRHTRSPAHAVHSVEDSAANGNAVASSSTSSGAPQVHDYLVGTQLDEAISQGQDLTISWPFADGGISDWTQAEAIWKYVLFNQLQLRRAQMESPVMLSIFQNLSRDVYERICLIFFERFNVAGFGIIERPVAQFYATISGSQLSGVVVDIDRDFTDIAPIADGFPVHTARTTLSYGLSHCELYLAHILRSNQSLVSALSPQDNPLSEEALQSTLLDLAQHLWQEGLIKVLAEGEAARDLEEEGVTDIAAVLVAGKEKAVIESGMKKRATAKATAAEQARAREIEALDLITVEFRGHSLTIGKERHRFCEPLFDPTLLSVLPGIPPRKDPFETMRPLHTAVAEAVAHTEVEQRAYIWQGLFVTGEITNHIKGLGAALQARLAPYILTSPDPQNNDVQTRSIRTLKIPDYFAEYREKGDGMASFLGTSIVAKLSFSDAQGKNFVSKSEYVNKGPRAILGMSPSLL